MVVVAEFAKTFGSTLGQEKHEILGEFRYLAPLELTAFDLDCRGADCLLSLAIVQ